MSNHAHHADESNAPGPQQVQPTASPQLDGAASTPLSAARIGELAEHAQALGRSGAQALRERAIQARDSAAERIAQRPLQAVLVAAGAGAALMWLAGLLSRISARRS